MHGTFMFPHSRLRHRGTPIANAINTGLTAIGLAAFVAGVVVLCMWADPTDMPAAKSTARAQVQATLEVGR